MDSTNTTGGIDRRSALGLAAAGLLGASAVGMSAGAQPEAPTRRPTSGRARNVILLISDGMSVGTFTLANMMRQVEGRGPGHWQRLWTRPGVRRAMCDTRSANAWVTDSAAAGSSLGIGERVNNRAVNITPDGRTPEPLFSTAASLGKATGLVTTTRLTHATPATMVATVPHRDLEDDIAAQMLDRSVDLMLGGGAKHFPASMTSRHDGVGVVRDASRLSTVAPRRTLGVFAEDHLPFRIDRSPGDASLEALAKHALSSLEDRPDGFVLQIEAGRVDHGAHNNDAAAMIADQMEFDDVVGAVAEWTADRDDTLVIVTTDHANANPGLTYYGEKGIESFERVALATKSFDAMIAEAGRRGGTPEAMLEAAQAGLGFELTDREIGILRRAVTQREPVDPFFSAWGVGPVLGSLAANHTGVAFVSPNHTSDYVEVTAFGPGSETLPPMIELRSLHAMMLAALSPRFSADWSMRSAAPGR
ncbi:MAG: alkaline phosphatase [Planctomycetota bacterium]